MNQETAEYNVELIILIIYYVYSIRKRFRLGQLFNVPIIKSAFSEIVPLKYLTSDNLYIFINWHGNKFTNDECVCHKSRTVINDDLARGLSSRIPSWWPLSPEQLYRWSTYSSVYIHLLHITFTVCQQIFHVTIDYLWVFLCIVPHVDHYQARSQDFF